MRNYRKKEMSPTIYTIMTIDDYDDVFALWNSNPGMGMRSLDDSRKGIDTFLKRNPRTCFVCRRGPSICGVILCGHDGRRGYIYHMAVHSGFQRKGIGRRLVEEVIEALKREGINKAALVVYADNERGNRFWESLGFSQREDLIYRDRVLNRDNT